MNIDTTNSSGSRIAELEEMDFLDIINIDDLICFTSKKILQDPVQLSCGHTFSRKAMSQNYLETKKKRCPRPGCLKAYTYLEEDSFLKKVVTSCINIVQQSIKQSKLKHLDSLKQEFVKLQKALPPSKENSKIEEAINLFLNGNKEEAKDIVANVIIRISDYKPYEPILDLMNNSSVVVDNQESLSRYSDQSTSQNNDNEYYSKQLKGVKFLTIIQIKDLVCPILKTIKADVDQLIPCGHHVSHAAMNEDFILKNRKICPVTTCAEPYRFTIQSQFMRKLITSVANVIKQPDQKLQNKAMELYEALPESEDKQKIKNAIDLFFNDYKQREARTIIVDIILANSSHEIYLSILQLMDEHISRVDNKTNQLIRQAFQGQDTVRPNQASLEHSQAHPMSEHSYDGGGQDLAKGLGDLNNEDSSINEQVSVGPQDPLKMDTFISLIMNKKNKEAKKYINALTDVNIRDAKGNAPLHFVISHLDKPRELIGLLIDKGADVDAQNLDGQTPLHIAAQKSKVAAIKQLRNKGALTDLKDKQAKIPLNVAFGRGSIQALKSKDFDLKVTRQSYVEDSQERLKRTRSEDGSDQPLPKRLRSNNNDRDLSDENSSTSEEVEVNSEDRFNSSSERHQAMMDVTPGFVVLSFTERDPIPVQIQPNSQPEPTKEDLEFIDLIKNKRVSSEVIDYIIKAKNLNVNVQDTDGNTPLHLVIKHLSRTKAVIALLIQKGANVNAKNLRGETPLHFAAKENKVSVIEQLRPVGADTTIRDNEGKIPSDKASSRNCLQTLKRKR